MILKRKKVKNSIDLTKARNFLIKLIPDAGKILSKYFISGVFTSRRKEGVDFLTQADEEVDNFLIKKIKKEYPSTNILTEETAPKNYSSLSGIDNLWVIDPLDGTINFSRQHANFAISIAFVNRGISQLGIVYVPMTKDLYCAQKDQERAFFNGKPIHVSSTMDMRDVVIACDWAWSLEKRLNVVRWLGKISTHVRQIKSMGSAVADLASLAQGKIDAYIHSGLKPWDVAASVLLIEKAGGKITTPTGKSWNVFQPDILASNGVIHKEILDLILH